MFEDYTLFFFKISGCKTNIIVVVIGSGIWGALFCSVITSYSICETYRAHSSRAIWKAVYSVISIPYSIIFQSIIHYCFSSVCIVHCGVILDHIIPRCGKRLISSASMSPEQNSNHGHCIDSILIRYYNNLTMQNMLEYIIEPFEYFLLVWLQENHPHDHKWLKKKSPWHLEYRRESDEVGSITPVW